MHYTELNVRVTPELADILVAELAELGYESFEENATGLAAYIPTPHYDAATLVPLASQYPTVAWEARAVPPQNWNATWESNYPPMVVDGRCRVRAHFHAPDPHVEYDLVITPKMSFGTGHHATTALMLSAQLAHDHAGGRVLDAGCGTGILAIMAHRRGADHVLAFDVEEWAVENARENAAVNHCDGVDVRLGTIASLRAELATNYDLILANINRNVLLAEIPTYAHYLRPGGTLLLSGFYQADLPDITTAATAAGLQPADHRTQDDWVCARFVRA